MEDGQAKTEEEQAMEQATESEQVDNQEIDYKAEYEKITQLTEKQKAEIAGLDKKVGEVSKQYNELLKRTETEAEAKEREAREKEAKEQARLQELAERETETAKKERALNVRLKAVEVGVDIKDLESLGISTVEGVEAYKSLLDTKLQQTKEEQAKNLESRLSGSREKLNKESEGTKYPNAINKAFR